MMPTKPPAITIPLLLSALLLASIAACSHSDSVPPHTDNAQTAVAPTPPAAAKAPATAADKAKSARTGKERREAIRQQLATVLTPDQAKQLETKMQQGKKMRQALTELNLTAEQNTKVQEIFKAAHTKNQKPAASPQ